MKEILIVITGSVAAFKALELIRLFIKNGDRVRVVLSKGGQDFVTPLSVSALSGNEVISEDTYKMEHITLSRSADLIIVCPASASFINKLAIGMGGEVALDIFLAKRSETKVAIAPAMNVEMLNNSIVKNNILKLQELGYNILDCSKGELLCKEEGEGRLKDVNEIYQEVNKIMEFGARLKGKKFLITNGGTVEKIDDVRFISNFSSGLQGALIAKELLMRGAEVYMVEGSVSYDIRLAQNNLFKFKVLSAIDMQKKVLDLIGKHKFDGFFAVAAVCDFRVKNRVMGKIKKDTNPEIILEKNPDILFEVSHLKINRPSIVCGFAAEEAVNVETNGEKKFKNKACDILFSNEMCFEINETKGVIFTGQSRLKFVGSKKRLAETLVNLL